MTMRREPLVKAASFVLVLFGAERPSRVTATAGGPIALAVALRHKRVGALLLLVVGLLKLALPLFPVDALGAPATSTGQMHNCSAI
ncbi:MAG TPA: hypothetical protein VE476_14820 [Propionibacteriaceae bacterium]|nr:hypothetical protein [Propionibacteriaceae bacterium]